MDYEGVVGQRLTPLFSFTSSRLTPFFVVWGGKLEVGGERLTPLFSSSINKLTPFSDGLGGGLGAWVVRGLHHLAL